MPRAAWLFVLLAGCATGSGEDGTTPADASVKESGTLASCDPKADPCPADQHCSPLTRQCIAGCHADAGCAKGKCDAANHECVGCLASSDCRAEEICAGSVCVAGCTAERPCPEGLTCCAGGCVDSTTNVDHCGACGKKCVVANGSPACATGKCAIASCKTPFENCDGDIANGCESDTTSSRDHCGACGKQCAPANATGGCAFGVCKVSSCTSGFGDCNGNAADGCEVDLARDPNNCGSCGNKPSETCNLSDDNCNGACDDLDGCRVGVHRSFGGEYFYTSNATEASCCGLTVESMNNFYLYSAGGADREALYRCYNSSVGRHFLTTSSTCEVWGAGAVEGVIGHIATKAICGSVPFYRLWSASYGHFFTTDAGERAAKLAAGWTDEGVRGYVWKSPRG